jgi:hypothetical protein
MEYGEHIKLKKNVLWCHDLVSNNWTINGYKKLCSIENVSSFWRLFNNFKKIGWKRYHFYFMLENTLPLWEENLNGGIFIVRNASLELWEEVGLYYVSENLGPNINGISINLKGEELLVKIWCTNTTPEINPEFLEKIKGKQTFFSLNKK